MCDNTSMSLGVAAVHTASSKYSIVQMCQNLSIHLWMGLGSF
jgi:hypothetical protein